MPENIGDSGYIRISNENDRITVASILFKNKYTVRTIRTKRNGRTYEYFVKYDKLPLDETGGGSDES